MTGGHDALQFLPLTPYPSIYAWNSDRERGRNFLTQWTLCLMMRDTEDVCTFMALLKSDVNFVAVRKMSVPDDITLTRSFTFHFASAFSL